MNRLPRAVALVLCKNLELNPGSRDWALVGVFHALTFAAFPAYSRFVVYTALYGGKGEGTMKLGITRLETGEEIYPHERWWTVPGQGLNVHVGVRVTNCPFPALWRCALSLSFDGRELTSRYLDVFLRRGSP